VKESSCDGGGGVCQKRYSVQGKAFNRQDHGQSREGWCGLAFLEVFRPHAYMNAPRHQSSRKAVHASTSHEDSL